MRHPQNLGTWLPHLKITENRTAWYPGFEGIWTSIHPPNTEVIAHSKMWSQEVEYREKKPARGSKGRKAEFRTPAKVALPCLAPPEPLTVRNAPEDNWGRLLLSGADVKNFVYADGTLLGHQKCKEYFSQKITISQYRSRNCKNSQESQIRQENHLPCKGEKLKASFLRAIYRSILPASFTSSRDAALEEGI